MIVAGTRPELLKLGPVLDEIEGRGDLDASLVLTGQQPELAREVCREMGHPPTLELEGDAKERSLGRLTGRLCARLDKVLGEHAPEAVLAQGDTTSALAAALAAHARQLPLAHLEAGLRSRDLARPHPEEGHRRMIATVTRWHLAPTQRARKNLEAEGVDPDTIFVTGNTSIDALAKLARDPTRLTLPTPLRGRARLALITIHRRENFERLPALLEGLRRLARAHPSVTFAWPLHPNPGARAGVAEALGELDNVALLDPLPHAQCVAILAQAALVLTDSGGVQEEAPWFGAPLLVLREVTERPEGVAAGIAQLVGADPEHIATQGARLLETGRPEGRPASGYPYGDGHAARRVVDVLTTGRCEELSPTEDAS